MAPFVLKFKVRPAQPCPQPVLTTVDGQGNKAFSPLAQLADEDSLRKTWKVCTKVAAHLENGQRLENLSWRCWFLHSLMVEADNAKSKREFKKMTKSMGEKLDKEKGRSIQELEAPDFKGTDQTSRVAQRAEEKERTREGHGPDAGGMKGMQYTFAVQPPSQRTTTYTKLANSASGFALEADDHVMTPAQDTTNEHLHNDRPMPADIQLPASPIETDSQSPFKAPISNTNTYSSSRSNFASVVKFPNIFASDFSPTALLGSASSDPSKPPRMSYGEDIGLNMSSSGTSTFAVSRPAFEFPLDDLMDSPEPSTWNRAEDEQMKDATPRLAHASPAVLFNSAATSTSHVAQQQPEHPKPQPSPIVTQPTQYSSYPAPNQRFLQSPTSPDITATFMGPPPPPLPAGTSSAPSTATSVPKGRPRSSSKHQRDEDSYTVPSRASGSVSSPTSTAPSRRNSLKGGSRYSAPSATAPPRAQRLNHGNTAPGGVKSECANCGATSTPLWRRGLNDELNCNACGLFAKLHKRARPKTLRNSASDTSRQTSSWGTRQTETADGETVACYNCHTTATPLWRKDESGRTLCNACGLYLKLHGERRPSSMKNDVIRKRARQESRRVGTSPTETPSASPGASRRTSPALAASPAAGSSAPEPAIHPPMLPSYDFSASAFEFAQITHDTTDRLTHQHEHDHAGEQTSMNLTLSPAATYFESLAYPSSSYAMQSSYYPTMGPDNQTNSTDILDTFGPDMNTSQAAFQEDGTKRRRVSPDGGERSRSHSTASTSGFVSSSASSTYESTGSMTSFDNSPTSSYDPFSSFFPFTFAPTPSGFVHPPMMFYGLPEEYEEGTGTHDSNPLDPSQGPGATVPSNIFHPTGNGSAF